MVPLTKRQLWSCLCSTALLLGTAEAITSPIIAKGPDCETKNGAVLVTPDCVDATYKTVVIDAETDFAAPVPHRKISGYFDGTTIDFNIYFPKTGWDGRFFQFVYPTQNSTAEDRDIAFGADSGAYTNRVAGGGGYRADAAIAKLSRSLAADYYKKPNAKIYGYVYGASGGSMVTVGAAENTFDVWQGALAMVQAVPVSNPNNFCTRALAGLVLEAQKDKLISAARPGGDLNPFKDLDAMRHDVLTEVTELGIPLAAWEDWEGVTQNRTNFLRTFRLLGPSMIASFDPTYVNDFWTKTGYVGTEKSSLGDFYRNSVYEYDAVVQKVDVDAGNVPVSITLNKVPSQPPKFGLQFTIQSSDGKGGLFTAQLDKSSRTAIVDPDQNSTILTSVSKDTKLRVDNRAWLAGSLYHRYQVPTRPGFYGYDYLRTADGKPKYPQRSPLIADTISRGASGSSLYTGNITGKLIVLDTLKDYDAMPWHADWYKAQVQSALGDRFNDNYRLHYAENADHYIEPVQVPQTTRLVDYVNMAEQHLRDLSAWVEKGTTPPTGTSYSVTDGQVKVAATASQRKGIQPVVTLTSSGKTSITVKAGRSVSFKAHIEVPAGTGSVTAVDWDFEGTGIFVKKDFGKAKGIMDITVSQTYRKQGTYYVAVRVASNRKGDAKTPYAQVQNLGRMKVVVN
ncbi:hypothetical protein BHE90_010422 [Fusarium euwallaceae]|uniref:PKD domain-containing protein n=1 Tax=Fusarium euwallaceae TaxID=1147111 RepID=A0A430LHB7_9HYPO|nr:hypothetical protein BHE90_010422 [Fusarium euwallaceae]